MKTKVKHKAFLDADGKPSMTEIVAIAQALPEALAALPVDELTKVLPVLQQIVATANGGAPAKTEAEATAEVEDAGENKDPETVEKKDAEAPAKAPKTEENKTPITDSAAFKDAVKAQVQQHIATVEKARQFLPETYVFADKNTAQIMRDALAVEHGRQHFSDSELEVAFKLLKKTQSQHQKFGDAVAGNKFTSLADKSL